MMVHIPQSGSGNPTNPPNEGSSGMNEAKKYIYDVVAKFKNKLQYDPKVESKPVLEDTTCCLRESGEIVINWNDLETRKQALEWLEEIAYNKGIDDAKNVAAGFKYAAEGYMVAQAIETLRK